MNEPSHRHGLEKRLGLVKIVPTFLLSRGWAVITKSIVPSGIGIGIAGVAQLQGNPYFTPSANSTFQFASSYLERDFSFFQGGFEMAIATAIIRYSISPEDIYKKIFAPIFENDLPNESNKKLVTGAGLFLSYCGIGALLYWGVGHCVSAGTGGRYEMNDQFLMKCGLFLGAVTSTYTYIKHNSKLKQACTQALSTYQHKLPSFLFKTEILPTVTETTLDDVFLPHSSSASEIEDDA